MKSEADVAAQASELRAALNRAAHQYYTLDAHDLAAGSAQARRLFS